MNKYIEVNGDKSPKTSFDVNYSSIDNLDGAGILLNEDVIVVDFDGDNVNEQEIINFLDVNHPTTKVITTRGVHFYYSKPKLLSVKNTADTVTTGGFQVDYKTGPTSYTIVKLNGKTRKGSTNINLNDLPQLPEICYPLKNAKNLTGMVEGDSRNNALFYHLMLVKEFDSNINRRNISSFISTHCFSEPLPEREIASTLESVEKRASNGSKKIDYVMLAAHVVSLLDINIYQNELYFKDDYKFTNDNLRLMRAIDKVKSLKRNQYKELERQLYVQAEMIDPEQKFPIILKNGHIFNGAFSEDSTGFSPFHLDITYDPKEFNDDVDRFIDEITLGKAELKITLEEIIGHCLMSHGFPHKVFFLLGNGRNGKSTFMEMINSMFRGMASHIALSSFDDPTSTASLIGKLVNCTDDIDTDKIDKTKSFKSISAGNKINVRPIYRQPVELRNTATLIVNANKLPQFTDKSRGLFERLVIVPFELNLDRKQIDAGLLEKLSTDDAKSHLINLGLAGLRRIINNKGISENKYLLKALSAYQLEYDSFSAFMKDRKLRNGSWVKEVYAKYVAFCNENEVSHITQKSFSKRLADFGYGKSAVKRNPAVKNGDNRDRRIVSRLE